MTRFLARLFGTRTPAAAQPARRMALSLESLETRETPSGWFGHWAQSLMHTIHQGEALAAHMSHAHGATPLANASLLS